MSPYVSVVIPAYNEEATLRSTVTLVAEKLSELETTFEIIIVNDGSTDRTRVIAEDLRAADNRILLTDHPRNLGPGSGVYTGIEAAMGEFVIFIPADLALDIGELHKYFETSQTCDLVVGVRSDRRDYSLARKFVSLVNIALIKLLFGMKERQFNYIHMYWREMLQQLEIASRSVFITAEIMIRARDMGYRLQEVEILYVPRAGGKAACGKPRVIFAAVKDLARFWYQRTLRKAKYLQSVRRHIS
jgi:glycosyltransferase involved in cell wall biosynthesis